MFRDILMALAVILPVTFLTGGLVYWRAEYMQEQAKDFSAEELPGVKLNRISTKEALNE